MPKLPNADWPTAPGLRALLRGLGLGLGLLLTAAAPAWGATTSAVQDLTCAGFRNESDMGCTAKEFTVTPVFSAAPGTAPFCMAGQEFRFVVDVELTGSKADRYDVGFFVGQQGNDPALATAGNICSVATFPVAPFPWLNKDGDSCGDYAADGTSSNTVDEVKVICAPDSQGFLQIPYVLTYLQNAGSACTGPAKVTVEGSKCNSGVATVSGAIAVYSGAYVDVTKQTTPDGDAQPFSFTATGPGGSKVIALTGATLTPTSATGGTYSPATIATATHTATATVRDGETVRFYIGALASPQTLTITEAATANWEPTADISCAAVAGAPPLTTDNATRTITAALSTTNSAAACTVTNTKRPRITLAKSVGGRVDAGDQFTVSASGGGTLIGTTSAATSGTNTSASTTFYSTPATPLTLTDTKAEGPTPLAEYDSRLTCTNAFTGPGATPPASLPANLNTTSTSLTPAPGDELGCTFTNTPRPRISLQKTIAPAGGGRVTDTDQFTLTATGATPVTTTGSGSAVTSGPVSLVATAGIPLALSESAAGTTDLANYASAFSCVNTGSGGTTVAPGSGTSFSVTPANNDVIACSFTNTRRSAELTLAKAWTNAVVNDAVQLSATGLNSRSVASTADTPNETDTDTVAVTVYAGETIILAESFTAGIPTDYAKSLSCTGSNGTLSHTPDSMSGMLAISGSDTLITCTFSNDKLMPSLTFLKSVQVASDPVNLALNPKYIPGAEVLYTMTVTNSGAGKVDDASLTIIDPIPANTELFTGSLSSGAPFIFADGAFPSGIACDFTALDDPSDCVDFSVDGNDWSYVPNGGFDPGVTHLRFRPAGSMVGDGTPGTPSPSFDLRFRVRVK
jgi:uncharacterized repeat protein (TIGR01451 family)